MRRSLVGLLVDPVTKEPLTLDEPRHGTADSIAEGKLRSPAGSVYPIVNGIPRFVLTADADQRQTERSFGFKWQQRATYESPQMRAAAQQWLVQRYGFASVGDMRDFFSRRKRMLDAGCGSGFSSSLWMDATWKGAAWFGVDISAAIDVAQERMSCTKGTHFIQADVLELPFRADTFDTIFSEGVLHHTPSTAQALKSLVSVLEPGGEMLFYVYRKKGPIREFTDDYIRGVVSHLEPQEAWDELRPLTCLGQALATLRAEVEVPEDIPYLGIKAGRYDVQRLVYWHFVKLFWNDALSMEENNLINFDWYHPRYAHRHTEDEVRGWCEEAGLSIVHFDAQESGFTVRTVRE